MKQLLLSLTVIVVVASLAAVGTYARFIDTETSENNIFQADPLDLILENPWGVGEPWGHSVLRTWHYENMYPDPGFMEPGDMLTSQVYLKSFGTSQADHVDIYCVNVNSEPDWDTPAENEAEDTILGYDVPPSPGHGIYDKDAVMIIVNMTYHTIPIIWGEENSYNGAFFTDDNGDGRISLAEFEAQSLHGLPPVPDGGEMAFCMTVKFATTMLRNGLEVEVGNEYQGDQTMMTLIFILMQ